MIQPTFVIPGRAPVSTNPPGPPPPEVNHEQVVAEYRQLREDKAALEDSIKPQVQKIKQRMEVLEGLVLDVLNRTGANAVNTNSGTVYKSKKTSYSLEDPAVFRQWAESHGHMDLYENRVSKEAMEEFVTKTGTLPPGVKISEFTTVNFRK